MAAEPMPTATPALTTVKHFRPEFEAYLNRTRLPALATA